MRLFGLLVTLAGALLLAAPVGAATVPITTYDVAQTPASGFGGWSHSYTGTETPTGRTISTSASGPAAIIDETGGSGTLNDGATSTTISETQLFTTDNDDAGVPIRPTITLHLAQSIRLQEILLRGGDIDANAFPGSLTGATVSVGGTAVAVPGEPSGTPVALGLADDVLDLRNTPLADIQTDQVVLSDFENPFGQFSVAEIVVDGASGDTAAPVIAVPDSPVTVVAAGPNGAAVSFIVTAHDAVDGPVPVKCDPPSGSTFGPGKTTVVCIATDAAGNSTAANFTVLVTLTASGLCKLTGSYVASSERYRALPPQRRAAIDKLVIKACGPLDHLVNRLTPAQKAKLVNGYKKAIDELAAERWLTAEQAATLKTLASAI